MPISVAYAPPPTLPCPACVSKPPVCTQYTRVPDAAHDRAGDSAQRERESVVRIRHRAGVVRHRRHAIERLERAEAVPFTNASCGLSTGTCDEIRVAAARS